MLLTSSTTSKGFQCRILSPLAVRDPAIHTSCNSSCEWQTHVFCAKVIFTLQGGTTQVWSNLNVYIILCLTYKFTLSLRYSEFTKFIFMKVDIYPFHSYFNHTAMENTVITAFQIRRVNGQKLQVSPHVL